MRVGIIGGGFGLSVQAPIINMHPKMEVSAVSTMHRHRLPEDYPLFTLVMKKAKTMQLCIKSCIISALRVLYIIED